ncbi:hypothetical protein F1C10_10660 [Sphingomonas sp. NBWT7]|uniref:hypothetical protein n=1 Tax=Sphingomonas sp. NBWT7 TaxID=2596913 RepID=UPI0016291CF9|nr:hypothetical protein [Sphingomonas sp. NBWT7]QNE32361.1 hypothetical protein F1C10_10660 [Sphingomonas sp. NBWT7]
MRRRWRVALAAAGAVTALIAVPIAGVELGCRAPIAGFAPHAPYRAILAERRPEARTWLTYPEWHIVYSAESLGRWLTAGRPPSGYPYGSDIAGFWHGLCRINSVARGQPGAGEAKVMIYTIGISFTLEMAIKAAYERTIGRFTEWVGGWRSSDDRYAAAVQTRYGAFMHEVPWYRFPFGAALRGAWQTRRDDGSIVRHVERRAALTAEYGVKAGYARAIGGANASVNTPDALTLRFVAAAQPKVIAAVDPRLRPVRQVGALTVVEAPRYAQFTDLVGKLATAGIGLVEIAGNDDIFVTVLARNGARVPGTILLGQPIERDGWRRVGTSVKVPALGALAAAVRAGGGAIEHVYDY